MTEAIGKQITYLRCKGLGYKSIALLLNISRENVRYYCKKHGLDGKGRGRDSAKTNWKRRFYTSERDSSLKESKES